MRIRLYIEPEAEAELEQAAERYEKALPGLGVERATVQARARVTGLTNDNGRRDVEPSAGDRAP